MYGKAVTNAADAETLRNDKKKNSASRRLRRFDFFFHPLNPNLL
jgi:hypothetical protein